MDWVMFALAALLVAVLQVAVWRRVRSDDAGASDAPATSDSGRVADARSRENDAPTLPCPSCGTENDAGYRFCRECVAQIHP